MATWRDRLNKCRLGDVELVHLSSRWKFGREHRVVSYPYQDLSDGEAMGRPPEELDESVEALGDDFDLKILRLRYLLKSKEPLTYVHPIWGAMQVRVTDRPSASYGHSGNNAATLELKLTRIEDAVPELVVVPAASVIAVSDLVYKTATGGFPKGFEPKKLGYGDIVNAVRNGIGDATMAIAKINNEIASKLGDVTAITQDLAQLQTRTAALINTPTAVASTLLGLAIEGRVLFETVVNAGVSVSDQFVGVAELAKREFGGRVVPKESAKSASDSGGSHRKSSAHSAIVLAAVKAAAGHTQARAGLPAEADRTKNRKAEASCYDALETLVRVGGVAVYCQMATSIKWSSRKEVASFRTDLLAVLRDLRVSPLLDAETVRSLGALIGEMDAYLESAALQAVQTEDYEVSSDRSWVLVAYERFGNTTAAMDILRRNPIVAQDPGRIPSGTVLEVRRG